MTRCPCTECQNRGCGIYHDRCREYQEYRQALDKIQECKSKERNLIGYIATRQGYKNRNKTRNTKQPFYKRKK